MQQYKRRIRSMIASVLVLSILSGFAFLTVHGAKTADELQQEIEELERRSEEIEAERETLEQELDCYARRGESGTARPQGRSGGCGPAQPEPGPHLRRHG